MELVVVGIAVLLYTGIDLAAKQVAVAKTAVERPQLPLTPADEDRRKIEVHRFAGGRSGVRI
jgi:hypothetical protein